MTTGCCSPAGGGEPAPVLEWMQPPMSPPLCGRARLWGAAPRKFPLHRTVVVRAYKLQPGSPSRRKRNVIRNAMTLSLFQPLRGPWLAPATWSRLCHQRTIDQACSCHCERSEGETARPDIAFRAGNVELQLWQFAEPAAYRPSQGRIRCGGGLTRIATV